MLGGHGGPPLLRPKYESSPPNRRDFGCYRWWRDHIPCALHRAKVSGRHHRDGCSGNSQPGQSRWRRAVIRRRRSPRPLRCNAKNPLTPGLRCSFLDLIYQGARLGGEGAVGFEAQVFAEFDERVGGA